LSRILARPVRPRPPVSGGRGAASWLADDHFLPAARHVCFAALAVPFVSGLTRPAGLRSTPSAPASRPEWAGLDQAH
jgi:hypothetical protein